MSPRKAFSGPLWPAGSDIVSGFSDEHLEFLCSDYFGRHEGLPKLHSPWLYWASEIYSHGRTIRDWAGWPYFLPIPAFSDHGIEHFSDLHGPELTNESRLYLTWSEWRLAPRNGGARTIVGIPHPWHSFFKKNCLGVLPEADGLLVFVPHVLPGHSYPPYDFDSYFDSLDREFGPPSAIMLGMHDIRAGAHLELRKYGLPILTAGNTDSPRFVERFVDIVTRFSRATSNTIGSQAYFCSDLGIDYFVFGARRELPRRIQDSVPASTIQYESEQIFRLQTSEREHRVRKLVDQALGVRFTSRSLIWKIRLLFIREMFGLLGVVWLRYRQSISKS